MTFSFDSLILFVLSAFLKPYVVLYGGTVNTGESYSGTVHGSTDVWVWDSRNGSWYNAQPQKQNNTAMQPQVYFGATPLPSSGQMIALANNVSGGGAMLQKLDTNTWSWSFPSSSKFFTFAIYICIYIYTYIQRPLSPYILLPCSFFILFSLFPRFHYHIGRPWPSAFLTAHCKNRLTH